MFGWHALQPAVPGDSNILRSSWQPSTRRCQLVGPEADISASMSNRAGLRSPASAALRMRVASIVLLDCVCFSGGNEVHAKSSATWMFLTVSGLKCLPSAAISVPKKQYDYLTWRSTATMARRITFRTATGGRERRAPPGGSPADGLREVPTPVTPRPRGIHSADARASSRSAFRLSAVKIRYCSLQASAK